VQAEAQPFRGGHAADVRRELYRGNPGRGPLAHEDRRKYGVGYEKERQKVIGPAFTKSDPAFLFRPEAGLSLELYGAHGDQGHLQVVKRV